MAKYGMSMCVLGMAEEFKEDGIAVNALWPKFSVYYIVSFHQLYPIFTQKAHQNNQRITFDKLFPKKVCLRPCAKKAFSATVLPPYRDKITLKGNRRFNHMTLKLCLILITYPEFI